MLDFFRYEQWGRVILLPLDEIEPNPTQPRRAMNAEELTSLAKSIEENGLIYPITVRKVGKGFELVTGQRRLAAFAQLGKDKIPAIVEELDCQKAPMHSLVENVQRSALTYVDEAIAMGNILVTQKLTQVQLADKLGMSQSTVANKLRLLKFRPEHLEHMVDVGLTERHARAMLALLDTPLLEEVLQKVVAKGLNVAQTEALVQDLLHKKPTGKQKSKIMIRDLRIFFTTINRAVDVMKQAGIGAVADKAEDEQTITYTITIPKKNGGGTALLEK